MRGKTIANWVKKGLLMLLTALLFAGAVPITMAGAMDSVRTVRVGYFPYAGYHETDANGNRSGYGFEYLQQIARIAGWNYEYVTGSWQECQQMLEDGRIDLLTFAQYSPERAERFDYSSQDIGTSSSVLTTRVGETRYSYGNWSSFDGMSVGVIDGNVRNTQVQQLAQQHGITLTERFYADEDKVIQALQNREIDSILTSSLRRMDREQVIAEFEPSPYYCIVKKGNSELLGELDSALNQLQMENSQLQYYLYKKYYGDSKGANVVPTQEEKQYIASSPRIRVAAIPQMTPYSYFDEKGEYQGLVRDVMDEIARRSGLRFTYLRAASQKECMEMISDGRADIVANFYENYNLAQQNHMKITAPYLTLQYSAISRNGVSPGAKVAVVEGAYYNQMMMGNQYRVEDTKAYPTFEDCIRAVESGECDVTYMNTHMADAAVRDSESNVLNATLVSGVSSQIVIGVGEAQDSRLYSILDKQVRHFSDRELSSIVAARTLFQKGDTSLRAYLYDHPIQILLVVSAVFIGVLLLVCSQLVSRRRYARHIRDLAYVDGLTGLGNVNYFYEMGQKLLREHKNEQLAVLSIDVSMFSMINDSYGRFMGDKVIRFIAQSLKTMVGDQYLVAREKSDHYFVLTSYGGSKEDIRSFMDLFTQKAGFFDEHGVRIRLNYDCGVYLISNEHTEITLAADFAQVARKQAKAQNGPGILFFDEKMETRLRMEKEIEDTMEDAMDNGEFQVYYQPKVDMRTGDVIGAEALVRWDSSTRGFLSPGDFIPVMERNSFIIELDHFVLEEVCKLLRSWLDSGKSPVPISVNQSRAHLREEHYVERLYNIMQRYEIPEGLIELELTETSSSDTGNIRDVVHDIKRLGFIVSMDDFGSGYSSLTFLNKVPLDVLKIDREFLQESDTSMRSRTIIKKVVEMAKELDMEVICEGVETQQQVDFLLKVGCDNAQGFLFAKPMPAGEFEDRTPDRSAQN